MTILETMLISKWTAGSAKERLCALAPIHPYHHLTLRAADLQRQISELHADPDSQVRSHERLAEGFAAIAPLDISTAWRFSQLAELLECAGSMGSSWAPLFGRSTCILAQNFLI